VISSIHRSWSILLQTVPGASRSLFLCLFIFLTHTAQAIVDTNSNGVSDLWEKTYNFGSLITNFDPLADSDGDGWSDGTEAISGTDPFDRIAPKGILPLQILHTFAVYITGPTGDPEIFTPAAVSITWPTLSGKQYTLFASVDLTAGTWLAIDNATPRIGTTAPMGNAFCRQSPKVHHLIITC
jgi:Bacterial TSP3 repeat